jgi:hypothetical protein
MSAAERYSHPLDKYTRKILVGRNVLTFPFATDSNSTMYDPCNVDAASFLNSDSLLTLSSASEMDAATFVASLTENKIKRLPRAGDRKLHNIMNKWLNLLLHETKYMESAL